MCEAGLLGDRWRWHARDGQAHQEDALAVPAMRQALLPHAEQEVRRVRLPGGQDPLLRVVQEEQAQTRAGHGPHEARSLRG